MNKVAIVNRFSKELEEISTAYDAMINIEQVQYLIRSIENHLSDPSNVLPSSAPIDINVFKPCDDNVKEAVKILYQHKGWRNVMYEDYESKTPSFKVKLYWR